jgi:hypothetical protein
MLGRQSTQKGFLERCTWLRKATKSGLKQRGKTTNHDF